MRGWIDLGRGTSVLLGVRDGLGWIARVPMHPSEPHLVVEVLDLARGERIARPLLQERGFIRRGEGGMTAAGLAYQDHDEVVLLTVEGERWRSYGRLLAVRDAHVLVDTLDGALRVLDASSGTDRTVLLDGPEWDPDDQARRVALGDDEVGMVVGDIVVHQGLDGRIRERREVEDPVLDVVAGQVVCIGRVWRGGRAWSELTGPVERELPGHVHALAGNARGLVAAVTDEEDGDHAWFALGDATCTVQGPFAHVVAGEHTLLATGAGVAAWAGDHVRRAELGDASVRGALWDEFPIVQWADRLVPLRPGTVPAMTAGESALFIATLGVSVR
ncbi:MAG: hypothetical protein H6734_13290 [Alphaproteobacteria bacterium]|nr:hypothetical protein [Alphaproteobacteria bacterium]